MEITGSTVQTVESGNYILFPETNIRCCNSLIHKAGSGLTTIKGNSYGRFKVTFNGNIAAVTSVAPISVVIALNGEPLQYTQMTVTPAAVNEYGNVSFSTIVFAPCGCCQTIAIENNSSQSISVSNANLIIEKVV